MHPHFETYLQTHTTLLPENIQRVSSMAIRHTLRRNEFILSTGEICRHKVFVISGMLRMFSTSADSSEHILQFAPENGWTLDVESYDKQIPSLVNISAIEPSVILCWTKADFTSLLSDIPQFKSFADQIVARNIYYNRQRMLTMLSATPEERYESFVREFPGYLLRLPLRMIAAYLGISIKTLTRIRHTQLLRS
ncbi:Crp/Fnr family transcriptional regulator [Mucilaginibacter galii]|uniref:cAMP-binding protein n=1 Tax=Mucilaginibacter galii TaxID=2005073 RepID=A0A917JA63_9SPHI|nr:Crp/Fnr family transcriptional regulator [Mucilaginibacter galii]GGI51940.1 cAMP-binding protein [Mucilaginibacter galii]